MIEVEQSSQLPQSNRRVRVRVLAAAAAAGLVTATALTAAVRAFTLSPPSPQDTNTFVRRAEMGMGERSLNQLANAEIRRDLDRAGMVVKHTVIYSTRIDGDTGTVVAQVTYGPPGGPAINTGHGERGGGGRRPPTYCYQTGKRWRRILLSVGGRC